MRLIQIIFQSEIGWISWSSMKRYAILVALVTHKLYLSHEYTVNVRSVVCNA